MEGQGLPTKAVRSRLTKASCRGRGRRKVRGKGRPMRGQQLARCREDAGQSLAAPRGCGLSIPDDSLLSIPPCLRVQDPKGLPWIPLLKPETVELSEKNPKEQVRVNETLMGLLFKLDSVQGVDWGVRKGIIKKAIALQVLIRY
ncbi:hypothetical protein RJ639_029856 [Escallonia herrerae]|uniref:BAG domain-containing protein n=1 Tax=Escallonia herrerae TaxID=1293975 RepID=A0AA88X1Q5_9ASTE|nr:hypothetical protein RJ639_029856 [Escallonia herrerae]